MKRSVLIVIASLALSLTASAQMPNNQRKASQRPTTYHGYRGTSGARHMPPQHTFSNARSRQPAFSSAQPRESTVRTAWMQPHTNTSFMSRLATANTGNWRRRPIPSTNDSAVADRRYSSSELKFNPRSRPPSSFVDRSLMRDDSVRRETHLANNHRWTDAGFRERPSARNSFVNRSGGDPLARRQPRQSFNDYWANANVRERSRTNNSFVNGSGNVAFWSGPRGGLTNNWRSSQFSGRQYSAFRNYQSQWHDSGWWQDHCDTIVFVTVYSEPFPFYFDAGYWYPAWGYYTDAYYPYDGPIYGYNDLSPDEVIANVQIQLYNEGYYDGPIDGILGPDTQAAIADYQADHGLAVTAAIDEPTVESLGLV